ncbi:hypothetical protein TrST_g6272 [Triparma strigata]|uniref:DNA-(apurinic or apyrimidinic site) lyase n=1 Tax=Triparma strigata TaxID=1606541 RepID=A0A9W7BZH6_9STRA|nr:hypothetical protein TrST_g6272 [Triparma strigata]
MVEGPGCTNNGNRVRRLCGQRVIGVSGRPSQDTASACRSQILLEVLSLGKELFLFFQSTESKDKTESTVESCVRVHFGMSGSVHIDGPEPRNIKSKQLTLSLHFSDPPSRLRIFDSTVSVSSPSAARSKILSHRSRDVCSPSDVWIESSAFAALRAASPPTTDLASAILDQDISPGTGNIIKNEALHRAGVHPAAAVGTLDDATLLQIVRECRIFSVAWQKAGRHPLKLIYDKTICGSCGGPVKMQRLGPGGGRPTFSCAACVTAGGPPKSSGVKRKRTADPPLQPPAPPVAGACKQHSRASKVGRVRKAGPNSGRLFFSCRVPTCNHFLWGDTGFGKCSCNKTATLKICKKEGPNTGRWFFTCRLGKTMCNHFSWATEETTARFGALLTPLT